MAMARNIRRKEEHILKKNLHIVFLLQRAASVPAIMNVFVLLIPVPGATVIKVAFNLLVINSGMHSAQLFCHFLELEGCRYV